MTDIVVRLREGAPLEKDDTQAPPYRHLSWNGRIREEAAQEIERLRRIIEDYQDYLGGEM